MSDEDAKQAYWREARRITSGTLVTLAGLTMLLPVFMPALNVYRFLRFPLGYFLAGMVSLAAVALLLYVFFARQQRNDRAHNMTLQF